MAGSESGTPVEPVNPSKKTSDILGPMSLEDTVQMADQEDVCSWNDVEFAQGNRVNLDGVCYECSYGRWVQVDD